jgi:hypothetical protein
MANNIITPHFRVSYPHVFKPQLNKLNNKDEFSVVCLFPMEADMPADMKQRWAALKKEVERVVIEKWGSDKTKWPKNLRLPFKKQEMKEDAKTGKTYLPAGYIEGAPMLNLKSSQRPGLIDQNKTPILDETEFYAGCWAHATIRAYAYDQVGNRGVAFGLQNIQKVKDGEPLAGRPRAEDEFAPIEGAATESAESLFS